MDIEDKDRQHGRSSEMLVITVGIKFLLPKLRLELGQTTIRAFKNMLIAKGGLEIILVCCCWGQSPTK